MTLLLQRLNDGDSSASDQLLPMVYAELRELAGKAFRGSDREHTLQATALVHEAFLKLIGNEGDRKAWDGRRHFFAVAATAMRRVLTDYARSAQRMKRGGGAHRVSLSEAPAVEDSTLGTAVDLIELHEALEELDRINPHIARTVELRFFSGMTVEEVAKELGVTERSVYKNWRAGRAILRKRMLGSQE